MCSVNPASVVSEAAGGSGALGLHQQQSWLQSGSVQPQRPGRLPLQVPAGVKLLVKVDGGGSGSDSSVCDSFVSVSSVKSRCFMRGCRAACSETTRTDMCPKPSHWSTAALRSGTDTQIL